MKKLRKVLPLFLALLLAAAVFPLAAFAEGEPEPCAHDWSAKKSFAATCTKASYRAQVCKRCGAENEECKTITGPARGHKWSKWRTVIEAYQNDPGLDKRNCTICGEEESKVTNFTMFNRNMFSGTSDWTYFWDYVFAYIRFIFTGK